MAVIRTIQKGATNQAVTLQIVDSTDGTPETGVVFNTSGIDLWYRREGAAKVSITEVTLAALTTAHADGGFLAISNGAYRLDVPDAAFATGSSYVEVGGTVTGMVVYGGTVELVDYDSQDSVRLGLTSLPNAAADAAGGLPISDAGGLDIDAQKTDVAAILVDTSTTLDGALATVDANVDAILVDTAEIGAAGAGLTGLPISDANVIQIGGVAQSATDLKDFADAGYDPVTNKVQGVVLVDTTTTNTDMRGTDSANTTTPPTAAANADAVWDEALSGHVTAGSYGKSVADIETDATAILADTNELQTDDVPGLIATLDAVVDTVKAETALIVADTNELQTDDVPGLISALNDPTAATITSAVWDKATSSHVTAGTFGKSVQDTKTDSSSILTDTAEIGAAGAGLTALPISDANLTQIGGVAQSATDLKDFADAGYDPVSNKVQGVVLVDTTTTNTDMVGTDSAYTGTPPTAAAISDQVWDEVLSGHVTAGTTGKAVTDIETDATAILADTNELQTDDVPTLISTLDAVVDTVKVDTAAILVDTSTTLQAELDGIQADTEDLQTQIGTAGAGLTAIPTQDANVVQWLGTAAATPTTAGVPEVDITHIDGSTAAAAALSASYIGIHSQVDVASATSSTVVLDDAAMSAVNDFYNGMVIVIYGGTGGGQSKRITDYVGATKTVTIDGTWATNPDSTSDIIIIPGPGDIAGTAPTAAAVADAVWDEAQADHTTAGTTGKSLNDSGGGGSTTYNNYELSGG